MNHVTRDGALPAAARAHQDDGAVLALTSAVMPVLAFYVVMDGVQCVLSGALRGAARAGAAAAINVASYMTGIGLAVALSEGGWGAGWGLAGIWWGFGFAVVMAAGLMTATLARQDWEGAATTAHARGNAKEEGGEGGGGRGARGGGPPGGRGGRDAGAWRVAGVGGQRRTLLPHATRRRRYAPPPPSSSLGVALWRVRRHHTNG